MKRVLIIEDDDNNYLLSHTGYTPIKAMTDEEGLQMALTERSDFVIPVSSFRISTASRYWTASANPRRTPGS